MTSQATASSKDLGALVSHHPIGPLGPLYLSLAFGLLATAIWLVLSIADASMAKNEFMLFVLVRIIAGMFATLALIILLRWLWFRGSSISVFERGISHTARGKTRYFRWLDIASVRDRSVRWMNVPLRRTWIRIKPKTHGAIKITDNYQRVSDLGMHLLKRMVPDHLARALKKIEGGQTLDLGAVRVNKQGLATTFRRLDWTQVKHVELRDGEVFVTSQNGKLNWLRAYAFQIDNLFVFLEIAKRYAPPSAARAG